MKRSIILLSTLIGLFFSFSSLAQDRYVLGADQELIVFGTSTLHNWEMVTSKANGEGLFKVEEGKLTQVKAFKISFKGEDLESGKKIMDRNTRRALDTENTPMISFELTELKQNDSGQLEAWGDFTAKGHTRQIMFEVNYTVNGDIINIEGSSSFKMTDFNIEPPVALAGTIRTSDVIGV